MQACSRHAAGCPECSGAAPPRHFNRLEAWSIESLREVVAEFKKPVMLYSVGKDTSVMLRLAVEASARAFDAPYEAPDIHLPTLDGTPPELAEHVIHCEERSDEAIREPGRKSWIASLRSQ